MQNQNLAALSQAGVSVWLDDLDRHRIESGNLKELIDTKSVVGVTTNPSIFEKALTSGVAEYQPQLKALADSSVDVAVKELTVTDVKLACQIFSKVYQDSNGFDGRVSLEVDPRLANDTAGTVAQAKELWAKVDQPNLMIKIPATDAGLPAITEVIASGISVNVTLIFSVTRYKQVIAAWLAGLEKAKANGHNLSKIDSVASFFVSRVDTLIDSKLDAIGTPKALAMKGKAAVANAQLAWEAYENLLTDSRWLDLAEAGAHPQRPLWASTGVKDPAYPDTLYVIELVADGCVNTMPESTLNAVADHGQVRGNTIEGNYPESHGVISELTSIGINFDEVFATLEKEGVDKFIKAWEQLLTGLADALKSAK
jgi:transaldolase